MGIYTDLALEAGETLSEGIGKISGVTIMRRELKKQLLFTSVEINTDEGARKMGKPKGIYLTLEGVRVEPGQDWEQQKKICVHFIQEGIHILLPKKKRILVIGLGNRNFTADSLGPKTAEQLELPQETNFMSFTPGVYAHTGMETARMVRGIIGEYKPDALLVVDALAARNIKRLTGVIQMSNTGIRPGSGVGNHRQGLYEENLKIPVLALGIPMVVSAQALMGKSQVELEDLYVTPRDIDEKVNLLANTLAVGIREAEKSFRA